MKKLLFSFLGLILCIGSIFAAEVIATKTVPELATAKSWSSGTQYSPFDLDDVITFTAKQRISEGATQNGIYYSDNASEPCWRIYQARDNGEFTISAKNGCKIKSITMKYYNHSTKGGVLCKEAGASVATEKQITSETPCEVKAKSITLYAGNSGEKTGGQVSITSFSVTYQGEYFKQNDVTIGLINQGYKNVNLSSLSGDAPLSYGSSDESVATVSDAGVITPVGEGETTITAYYGANKTGYSTSYTLHVSKGIYYEAFSPVAVGGYPTNIQGDIFNWESNSIRRNVSDTLKSGQQGWWIQKDKYIQTKTAIEGGVKSIKFKWKQFAKESTNVLKMDAKWGASSTVELINQAAEAPQVDHEETKNIGMTSNSQLKFENTSTQNDNNFACRIVLADIQFTPYLLFINKNQSVNCASASTFDFSTIIVDNTGATPTYSVTDDGGTGCAGKFTGSVLDLSDVCKSGDISVKAKWGDVETTTTLTVTALPAPTAIELNVPAAINATVDNRFQIIGTLTPADANPNVEWSSSAPENVSVDQNGMITILNANGATITLKSKADESVFKSCAITASTTTDEPFIENFSSLDEYTTITSKKSFAGTHSMGWIVNNFIHDNTSKIGDGGVLIAPPGAPTAPKGKNYIAYNNKTAMEGGVKRVAFQWKAVSATDSVVFIVDDANSTDQSTENYIKLPANSSWTSAQNFSKDLNYASNAFFRIYISSNNSSNVIFGPMTITPYLLYKTKLVTLTKDQVENTYKYKYTNDDIINNTGDNVAENFTYTISGPADADKIAIIKDEDKHTGKVTILGKGTVTVTATWGQVSTSYQLIISEKLAPTLEVEETKTIDFYGNATPSPTVKIGSETITDATFTYGSSNAAVISISDNKLTNVGTGETTITTTLNSTDYYSSKADATVVTVTEPTDPNKYWKETFSKLNDVSGYVNERKEVLGDDGVFNWYVRNYKRSSTADLVNGEVGVRLRYLDEDNNNYIEYDGNQEGGIKYIFFNWRRPAAEKAAKVWVDITVTKDDETLASKAIREENVASNAGGLLSRSIKVTKNAKLKIAIPKDGDGVPVIIGPITITPYLLYKVKTYAPTADQCAEANYKYTNEALINNTGKKINATQKDIVFSIVGEDETTQKIAVIDEHTGQVTMRGAGQVTIKATWGDVFTTYQLTVPQLTPTIELDAPDDLDLDKTYTPEPKAKIGDYTIPDAAFTYTNIDANVAKEVEGVIYPQSPGTTDVKAVLTGTSSYASANTKVSLTVKDYTPEDGKYFEEGFTNVTASTSGWTTTKSNFDGDKKFNDDVNIYKWEANIYRTGVNGYKFSLKNKEVDKYGYVKMDGNCEGGIKFVGINWLSSAAGNMDFTVSVNEKEVLYQAATTASGTYRFAHFFNEPKEACNLSIQTNPHDGADTYLQFNTVTIMPYLLYTRKAPAPKAEELAAANYEYTNNDLINNTGVNVPNAAITFEIVESGKENVATIDANTGVVTCKGAGTVTVKATWQATADDVVTTTYELTVPKLLATVTYDDADITVADTLPLPVAKCNGEVIKGAVYNYESSDPSVIKVSDDKHSLIMVSKGNTKITATLQESDQYQGATAVEATINIASAPANKCFVETFENVPTQTWGFDTKEFNGDNNVYKWIVHNYGTGYVGMKIGLRNKNGDLGYLKMNGNQEGGIKFVEFDWKQSTTTSALIDYTVTVNEQTIPYSATVSSDTYHFAHCFNEAKKDNALSFDITANSKTYLCVGDVTIVPYLLYTLKTKEIKIGETYTNTNLIDNRDNTVKIEYSVTEGETYASVDEETGEVTGLKEGTATIQAKWGEVITTYQVTVSKESSITLDEEEDNSVIIAGYADTKVATVKVIRKLSAGKYNTFCVPFEISKTDLQTALGTTITKLVTLDESQPGALESEGGQMNLNIAMKVVDDIEAGKPYLIEVAESVNSTITFSNVTIKDVGSNNFFQSSGTGNKVKFYGITSPYAIPSENKYLFMSNNRLSWNNSGAAALMKGLRSYFHADVENPNQVAARLVFNQPQTPTTIETPSLSGEGWGEASKVIINNQLIIIRDGKMYNAMGAEL